MYNEVNENCYRPYNDVAIILSNPQLNFKIRLSRIWNEVIGKKIECDMTNYKGKQGDITHKITQFFTNDPIAYEAMVDLIVYKPESRKISIIFPYSRLNPEKQDIAEIRNLLKSEKQSSIILAPGSNFVALIHEDANNPSDIKMYIWDLRNIITPLEIANKKAVIHIANYIPVKLSTSDSIYQKILYQVYSLNPYTDFIEAHFVHSRSNSNFNQNILDLELLLAHNSSVLILEPGSNYAAIITYNKNKDLKLYIWDLTQCS